MEENGTKSAVSESEASAVLVEDLKRGALTADQQRQLAELLSSAPHSVLMTATHHQCFSGPLPPPEQFQQYSEDARQIILKMAQDEQTHAHSMAKKALDGAISKDRRGQITGGLIAIGGLAAAAWIAPYSAVAAAIIGALDLFGMVALFVAPRVLEHRDSKSADEISRKES